MMRRVLRAVVGDAARLGARQSEPAAMTRLQHTSAQAETSGGQPVRSRMAGLLLLLPGAAAAGLGFWQIQRYQWKVEQMAEREAQMKYPALPLRELRRLLAEDAAKSPTSPPGAARSPPSQVWRLVECEGELLLDKAQYVGPRMRKVEGVLEAQPGYLQIVPLQPRDGSPPVLVNRGWVPARQRAEKPAPACVKAAAVVRASEAPPSFTPEQKKGNWFWVDVPALAAECGLPPGTPLLDIVAAPGPAGGAFPAANELKKYMEFPIAPEHHLQYAATWFTLAAATAFLARGAIVKSRRRIQHTPAAAPQQRPS